MSPPLLETGESTQLSPRDFALIADIAKREAGLALSPAKSSMISARIARRLRATGQQDFGTYMTFLQSRDGTEELRMLISALTTNVSHFFREEHHFRTLEDELLPRLAARARAGGRVRLWSAGCATGQEPYSIAIAVLRQVPDAADHDFRILATDIDEAALSQAIRGRFARRQMEAVPRADWHRFFRTVEDDELEALPALRNLVRFRRLNLVAHWPVQGPFDVVFCRNVVIYFDGPTQASLWPRFHRVLGPDGVLFLGHSERLDPASAAQFVTIGVTSYRKAPNSDLHRGVDPEWH